MIILEEGILLIIEDTKIMNLRTVSAVCAG